MLYVKVKNNQPSSYPNIRKGFYLLDDVQKIFCIHNKCVIQECKKIFRLDDKFKIIDHINNTKIHQNQQPFTITLIWFGLKVRASSLLSFNGVCKYNLPIRSLTCIVCGQKSTTSSNALICCDGRNGDCKVIVHQECYGVLTIPKNVWLCRMCLNENRPISCVLCPNENLAFKQIDIDTKKIDGTFVHVICALYIPGVDFADENRMEPIDLDLDALINSNENKNCYICEEENLMIESKIGVCMKCEEAKCERYFHVTCAQKLGLLCEQKSPAKAYIAYCLKCKNRLNKKRLEIFLPAYGTKCLKKDESGYKSIETITSSECTSNSSIDSPSKNYLSDRSPTSISSFTSFTFDSSISSSKVSSTVSKSTMSKSSSSRTPSSSSNKEEFDRIFFKSINQSEVTIAPFHSRITVDQIEIIKSFIYLQQQEPNMNIDVQTSYINMNPSQLEQDINKEMDTSQQLEQIDLEDLFDDIFDDVFMNQPDIDVNFSNYINGENLDPFVEIFDSNYQQSDLNFSTILHVEDQVDQSLNSQTGQEEVNLHANSNYNLISSLPSNDSHLQSSIMNTTLKFNSLDTQQAASSYFNGNYQQQSSPSFRIDNSQQATSPSYLLTNNSLQQPIKTSYSTTCSYNDQQQKILSFPINNFQQQQKITTLNSNNEQQASTSQQSNNICRPFDYGDLTYGMIDSSDAE